MDERSSTQLPAPGPVGSSAAPTTWRLPRAWWIAGLGIAGLIVILAAAFASSDPDGLDSVAIQEGFQTAAAKPGFQVLPDYAFPGLEGTVATVVAGLVGIAIVFGLVLLLGRLLARRRKNGAT